MYRLKFNDAEEKLPTCNACGYPVPASDLHFFKGMAMGTDLMKENKTLCTLCANSKAGSSISFSPDIYPNGDIYCHINFAANAILDQLGAFKED